MASVACRIDDVERGDLPAISVKSGKPCDNAVAIPMRIDRKLLSPGGRKVIAVVPLEEKKAKTHRVLNAASWVVLVLFVASLAAEFAVGLIPAVVFFVVYFVLVVVGDRGWISCRSGAKPEEMVLTNVHPEFAREVEAQYHPAAQPDTSE